MIYAIGDIHGMYDLVIQLHHKIVADMQENEGPHKVIFLGDYVDRGPDSKEVVEYIMSKPFRDMVALMGNHEALMVEAVDKGASYIWIGNGGIQTLQSYNDGTHHESDMSVIDPKHIEWMRSLPQYHWDEETNHLFVHAGVNPWNPRKWDGWHPNDFQNPLLWIRDEFLNHRMPFGFRVVHGHTPAERAQVTDNRVSIDTGAKWTGILTCAVIEKDKEPRFIQTSK